MSKTHEQLKETLQALKIRYQSSLKKLDVVLKDFGNWQGLMDWKVKADAIKDYADDLHASANEVWQVMDQIDNLEYVIKQERIALEKELKND